MKKIIIGIVILFSLSTLHSQYSFEAASVGFIENKGQIIDQNNLYNPDVLYLAPVKGMNVQLRARGFSYDTHNKKHISTTVNQEVESTQKEEILQLILKRIDIEWIGTNPNCEIKTEKAFGHTLNYYGHYLHKEIMGVRQFEKVIYKNIYNHIDLEFVIANDKFKYNFILHPGADIQQIRWIYKGAEASLKNNQIYLEIDKSIIKEKIPFSFLSEKGKQKEVKVSYISYGQNQFGFSYVGDLSSTLTIDPLPDLMWGSYYGGNNKTEAYAISSDKNNRIYVGGHTFATNNIASTGAFQDTILVPFAGYFGKFTKHGLLVYGTYYSALGTIRSIECDRQNNLIVYGLGFLDSLASPGAFQTTIYGFVDGHFAKFDSLGNRIWATYYGSFENEQMGDMTLDSNDNIIVSFITESDTSYLSTPGTWQQGGVVSGSGARSVIAKFSPTGNRLWGSYVRGNGSTKIYSMATGPDNVLYVGGDTYSTDSISTSGTFMPIPTYSIFTQSGFVMKFDSLGHKLWGTYYQSNVWNDLIKATTIDAIKTDKNGYVYFGGMTEAQNSTNFGSSGAYQTTNAGGFDVFLAKFNPNGTRVWGTFYGGINDDGFYDLTIDYFNNLYVAASTYNSGLTTSGAYSSYLPAGEGTGMLAKFTSQGQRIFSTYYSAELTKIEMDSYNKIIIAGRTKTTDSIATSGTYQSNHPLSGSDYSSFVSRFSDCDLPSVPTITSTNSPVCSGTAATITFSGQINQGSHWGIFSNGLLLDTTYGSTFTVYPVDTTSYQIRGLGGCVVKSDAASLTIATKEAPMLDAGQDSALCVSDSLILQATGNAISYQWSNGVPNGSYFVVNNSSTLIVSASAANACTSTDTLHLTALDRPQVNYINGFHKICRNAAPRPLFGGLPVGGSYSGQGVYGEIFYPDSVGLGTFNLLYTYTDTQGCSSSASDTLLVDPCNGIDDLANEKAHVKVYPNPAEDYVIVEVEGSQFMDTYISIYSLEGREIHTCPITKKQTPISTKKFTTGHYYYVVTVGQKNIKTGLITKK